MATGNANSQPSNNVVPRAVANTQARNDQIAVTGTSSGTPTVASPQALNFQPRNNLPFDRRLMVAGVTGSLFSNSTTSAFQQVTKGFIRALDNLNNGSPTPSPTAVTLFFQFNPITVSQTVAFNPDAAPPDTLNVESLSIPDLATGQSISFQLLYDRSYEVASGLGNNQGVLLDVEIAMALMGITPGQQDRAPVSLPVQVFIGGADIFGFANGGVAGFHQATNQNIINFTGHWTGFDVQYLRFSASMIPTRCMMNLSFERIYVKSTGSTDANNSNSVTVNGLTPAPPVASSPTNGGSTVKRTNVSRGRVA